MSDPSRLRKIGGEMARFYDTLHAHGDDDDETNDTDVDFDYYFTNFDQNQQEPNATDISWIHPNVAEQEYLSQRLSQLQTSANVERPTSIDTGAVATTTTTTTTAAHKRPVLTPTTAAASTMATKRFRSEELSREVAPIPTSTTTNVEEMPAYLAPTNSTFESLLTPLLPQNATIDHAVLLEELRQMAFLEHELQLTNLEIKLWTVYRQSGTGELQEEDTRSILQQLQYPQPTAPRIWPKRLKRAVVDDSTIDPREKKALTDTTCLNYANRMLTKLNEESRSYQAKIEEKREYLKENLTPEIENAIVNLVQNEGIALDQIVVEGYIAAVQFNYKDRLIDLEFEQNDPTREHIPAYQTAVKSRTAYETAIVEVELLKQRVAHHQLSALFDSFELPTSPNLETIEDPTIRQRLSYRYEQLSQRTKSDMMLIYIHTAQAKLEEARQKFERDQKLCYQPQSIPGRIDMTRFNRDQSQIMGRRFRLIVQRLQTLLDLKVRFFVRAPTVNKH